jgi:hypothetical protein
MDKQHLEVRSQVLSLREGELESRLHEREREKSTLEEQLTGLTLLLRREQVTRDVQAQRIQELENQLGQCRRQIATMIAGAIVKRRGRQHRQPAAARSSGSAIRRRSPSAARASKPTRSKTSKIRKTIKAKQLPTRKRRR